MENLTETSLNLSINQVKINELSNHLLDFARKLNIFATVLVVLMGLIGHSLIIFVFVQKRFRTNSGNVFLLYLAVNDSIFLITHFFEDTIKSYGEIYINEANSYQFYNRIIQLINLSDRFEIFCNMVNYLRYVLRFISSYVLVAFTIQRLSIIYSPLSNRFKSKTSAWVTCLVITIISLISNIWVPFIFKLQNVNKTKHCDVEKEWNNVYFQITTAYIFITMVVPIIIIFTSNSIIICRLVKADTKRLVSLKMNTNLRRNSEHSKQKSFVSSNNLSVSNNLQLKSSVKSSRSLSVQLKPHYSSITQIANRCSSGNNNRNNSKNSTKIVLLISFVFIVLNVPYLLSWFLFYYQIEFNQNDLLISNEYLFTAVQISEIIHMINYAVLFYVYCASGRKFRNQLKYSSKYYSVFPFFTPT